jgi:hypothetical protein
MNRNLDVQGILTRWRPDETKKDEERQTWMSEAAREQMHSHIMQMLAKYDIIYTWARRPKAAWGAIEIEEVHISPIRSAISYATALHEIGHIRGRFQRSKSLMVRERWAWRWAEENALAWTPKMARDRRECLSWYTARTESGTIALSGLKSPKTKRKPK